MSCWSDHFSQWRCFAISRLLYRGRIDDRVADFGKRRVEPTRRDLRLALDDILAGKPVQTRLTKAVGCYIPEDNTSERK